MSLQDNSNTEVNFSRLLLFDKVTKPQQAIAFYPTNNTGTTLSVLVNSTSVSIRYISSTVETHTVQYVNKSIPDIVNELNKTTIPVDVRALSRAIRLEAGSLEETGAYKDIPLGFTISDRTTTAGGVVIRLNRYTIQQSRISQITVLEPHLDSSLVPWYPRISVGSFTQKYKNKLFTFDIPEYHDQTWSSNYGKPFKEIRGHKPIFINDNTLRVSRFPILWDKQNLLLYNGQTPLSNAVIEDIDVNNGFIYIRDGVFLDPDSIRIDYTYFERNFLYKGVNINGHFSQNPVLLDRYVLIYLLPTEGNNALPGKSALRHVIGSSIPDAIEKIKAPREIPIAIIGAYSIQQVYSSNRASILDTRSRGGGLVSTKPPVSPIHDLTAVIEDNQSREIDIEDVYNESNSFWDIGRWDGEVYPGAASIVVDLPEDLRDVMPISDIKQRASKHLSAGVYPIFNFYERSLPDITTYNTQVSTFFNGDFSQGNLGWIADNYEIPNNSVLSVWTSSNFDINIPIHSGEGGHVLTVGPRTGIYQSYLKTTPITAITWKEREVLNPHDPNQPLAYTEWEDKINYNERDVDLGHLNKDYLYFKSMYGTKQFKDVKVYSPMRIDSTGEFKDKLKTTVQEIYDHYSNTTGTSPNVNYVVERVNSDASDNQKYILESDYIGLHPSYDFVPRAYDILSGFSTIISDTIEDFNSSISGAVPKVYLHNSQNYEFGLTDYTVSMPLVYKDATNIVEYVAVHSGKGSDAYDTSSTTMYGLIDGIDTVNNYIVPDYEVSTASETEVQINPIAIKTSQHLGYGIGDSITGNEDYRIHEMLPFLTKAAYLSETYTGDQLTGHEDKFALIETHLDTYSSQVNNLISSRSFSLSSVADHWYTTLDRLGKTFGNNMKDLCHAMDWLHNMLLDNEVYTNPDWLDPGGDSSPTEGQKSVWGLTGIRANTIHSMYTIVSDALEEFYEDVRDNIFKGGIIEPEMSKTLYSYAWFARNASGISTRYNSLSFSQDQLDLYYGLALTGTKLMIKGMIDTDGRVHETTLVNQDLSSFPSEVATDIFDTIRIQPEEPDLIYLAYGLHNNITGHYNNEGIYWVDSTKLDVAPGKEYELAEVFTDLYNTL